MEVFNLCGSASSPPGYRNRSVTWAADTLKIRVFWLAVLIAMLIAMLIAILIVILIVALIVDCYNLCWFCLTSSCALPSFGHQGWSWSSLAATTPLAANLKIKLGTCEQWETDLRWKREVWLRPWHRWWQLISCLVLGVNSHHLKRKKFKLEIEDEITQSLNSLRWVACRDSISLANLELSNSLSST